MRRVFSFVTVLCLALAVAPMVAHAQAREVTGRITRTLGDVPVVGATVVEVGGQGVAQTAGPRAPERHHGARASRH